MASKDVELVIKARNEASRAIDAVSSALKDLAGTQDSTGKSAGKVDGLLGKLGEEFRNLTREAAALGAVGKAAVQIDIAGAAVLRIEADTVKAAQEIKRLSDETGSASERTARLRAESEAAASAIDAQRRATAAARAEQTSANRELRAAETALARLERRSGANPAGASADIADQRLTVADLRGRQGEAAARYQAQKAAQDELRKSLDSLNTQVAASVRDEANLRTAVATASAALSDQREALSGAKGNLAEMGEAAEKAAAGLGILSAGQTQVAEASARTGAQLAQTKARIEALQNAPKVGAAGSDPLNMAAQRRVLLEAKRDWVEAEAEVKRLAQAMRGVAAPTAEMGAALGRAQGQARGLKDEYLAQREALGRLGGTVQSTFAQFSHSASAMRAAGSAAQATGSALGSAAFGASSFASGLAKSAAEAGAGSGVFGQLRNQVLGLASAYVGLQAAFGQIGGVIKSYQTLEAAQSRLGAVFNQDTDKVAAELDFLKRQAARLGISFATLADEYGKFTVAASAANFTSEATRKVFLSVAEAGRVNKLSADQMSGVFLALTQMISKGKVQAEELRGQLGERLPGAFNIFADALGITTEKLDEMLQAGQVLATQGTLLKFADALNVRFGPQLAASLKTTTTEIGRFQNELFNAHLRVANGGFVDGLNKALASLNDWFASIDGQAFFQSLGAALGRFASALAVVPRYFNEIKTAVLAVVGLKLGGWLAGVAGSLGATTNAAKALSAELAFIGPPTQALTLTQRTLMSGFAQTVSAIDAYRASLLSSTSSIALARAGALSLAATLNGVRATIIGVAAVARGLWAAVGGLPGLILTGITFALGSWLTSVDKASTALEEHKRLIGDVVDAYGRATDKAGDFAKEVKGASSAQIKLRIGDAESVLDKLRKSVQAPADAFGVDTKGTVAALKAAVDGFRTGEKSAADFKAAVNAIAEADPKLDRGLVDSMLKTADQARDSEQTLAKLRATLALVEGNATDSQKALLGLKGAATDALTPGKFSLDAYTDAIDTLKGKIPELAAQMKLLKSLLEVDAAGVKAFAEAVRSGDFGKVRDALNVYGAARASVQSEGEAAIMKEIAGNSKITAQTLGLIKNEEGLRLSAYKDEGGTPTIAYGSTTFKGQPVTMGMEISKEEAYQQLVRDVAMFAAQVDKLVKVPITDAMRDALTSLAYNTGKIPQALLDKLNAGDYAGAQAAIRSGVNTVNGRPNSVLTARRSREADLFGSQGLNSPEIAAKAAETEQKRLETLKEYNTAFKERISDAEFETRILSLSKREQEIQKKLRDENNAAVKAGTELTAAQVAQIRSATGALYDQQHAEDAAKEKKKEAEEAEKRVNDLYATRQQLLEQQKLFQDQGDTTKAEATRLAIEQINAQLRSGIEAAIALWQAIGGAEADKAIAKLQTTGLNIQKLPTVLLTAERANDMLATGLTSTFSEGLKGFGEAIAGAKSFGDAIRGAGLAFVKFAANFLQQIGEMIIKQTILNALQSVMGSAGSGGAGGALAGFVNSLVRHDGGLALAGVGQQRRVPVAAFRNAVRYHEGGLAGFKPNEVPAILERNEEVLTADDPRNRLNGGLSGSQGGAQSIRNVLLFDSEEIPNAMANSSGERVILNVIKKNQATVRNLIS